MTKKRKNDNNNQNNNNNSKKRKLNQIDNDFHDNNNNNNDDNDEYDEYNESEDLNTIFNNKKQFKGVMKKYWSQRHNLFSKYDNGIILTKELWFSVTPEKISKFIANFITKLFKVENENENENEIIILDSFCGGGGNIVQFLKADKRNIIYAIDINKIHLNCTNNNSLIYIKDDKDVNKRLKLMAIDWIYSKKQLDSTINKNKNINLNLNSEIYADEEESLKNLEILAKLKINCVFGSPPWGGPGYLKEETFNLENLLPFGLEELLDLMLQYSHNVCLFLPRNSNLQQIKEITKRVYTQRGIKDQLSVRIVHLESNGYRKGILCCWGNFV
jgi:trimethylguanosine synthase